MTITPEYIEAEVEAEVRRIEAWNNLRSHSHYMTDGAIRSLANHLVRNRLQVEAALLTAAKAAEALIPCQRLT